MEEENVAVDLDDDDVEDELVALEEEDDELNLELGEEEEDLEETLGQEIEFRDENKIVKSQGRRNKSTASNTQNITCVSSSYFLIFESNFIWEKLENFFI